MTTIRTLATHEIVQRVYPRPVTERDELGMAVGRAVDGALNRYSHEFREGRRPTAGASNRMATVMLDEELAAAGVHLEPAQREVQLAGVAGVLQAFRRSELMGALRPRSRLILVNGKVGIYAQPDYWNGRDRFFEMKSYRADPATPHIALQLRLFQLAFPGFATVLACFDRHATPVTTRLIEVPVLDAAGQTDVLSLAYRLGTAYGFPKVLEYVDSPTVRYEIPEPPDSPGLPSDPDTVRSGIDAFRDPTLSSK